MVTRGDVHARDDREPRLAADRAPRSRELQALAPYLRAVRSAPLLTRDEERALGRRSRAGDAAARQLLVRRNLALVVAVVRTQQWGGLVLEDVIQEGNLGLIRAATSFDPDAGTRFSTYAVWWIRAYVGKYLKEARSAVRPRSGMVAQPDVSLDVPVGEDLLVERIPDDRMGPEEVVAAAELDRLVRAAIEHVHRKLRGLGRDIVRRRFRQDPPATLEAIGKRWGVSRERVRQVEVRAKSLLRRRLEERLAPPATRERRRQKRKGAPQGP